MLQDISTTKRTSRTMQPPILISEEEQPVKTFYEIRHDELLGYRKPTFSMQFVDWVTDRLTEILIARLRSRGDNVSEKMLDYIILLAFQQSRMKSGKIQGMNDDAIVETLAEITRYIPFWEKG